MIALTKICTIGFHFQLGDNAWLVHHAEGAFAGRTFKSFDLETLTLTADYIDGEETIETEIAFTEAEVEAARATIT